MKPKSVVTRRMSRNLTVQGIEIHAVNRDRAVWKVHVQSLEASIAISKIPELSNIQTLE
jgi:hypothetical protein